ncbi:MAG: amidohydrolase family protein, partial [Actinomycetota bacterium]
GFFRAGSVKLIMNLVPEAHQAWLLEPYCDGYEGEVKPVFPIEEMREIVAAADRLGLQMNMVTIGDRAVHEGLNAYELATRENPEMLRRHTLEHTELIADEDLERFVTLGVTADFNPMVSYPEEGHMEHLEGLFDTERLNARYHRGRTSWRPGPWWPPGATTPWCPWTPSCR